MAKISTITAIIVNYNDLELLKENLPLVIRELQKVTGDLIVVDNNSTDGSRDFLKKFCAQKPSINLQLFSKNIGLARAANFACSVSSGQAILLLNPDVKPLKDSIKKLIDCLSQEDSIGMIAPKLVNANGSLQYSCRTFYTPSTLIMRKLSPRINFFKNNALEKHHLMLDWDHNEIRDIDWALGAALLIRKAAITNNQLFDPRYFLYFEDVDLAFNFWKRGWRVTYLPEAKMAHLHKRTSSQGMLLNPTSWHHLFSMVKFFVKNGFNRPENQGECE